jgi:hypothetical protein
MKQYMLRVLNKGDHQQGWPEGRHEAFVKQCEVYIKRMQEAGNLSAAQPLAKQGVTLSGRPGHWRVEPLDVHQEIQVGYYLVRAESVEAALELAKGNPEFEYGEAARVEVRPIKAEEESTQFVYPTG